MTDRQKLLLAMVVPVIVLAGSVYFVSQQLHSVSAKANAYDDAQVEVGDLKNQNSSLLTHIRELENQRDQWQETASAHEEQLQRCQSELAQLQRDQANSGLCAFVLGEVDPLSDCITIKSQSSEPLDLAGWTVSDGEGSYTFPFLTRVEPFGSFQVCISTYNPDRAPQQLLLQSSDDEVYLLDPDGKLCDQVSW